MSASFMHHNNAEASVFPVGPDNTQSIHKDNQVLL